MDAGIGAPRRGGRCLAPLVGPLLLGAALTCSVGCGTVATFSDGLRETDSALSPKPFGGTRLDARAISVFCGQDFPWSLLSIAFLLDMPLSAAADLVTLPVTLPLHLARPEEAPPAVPPEDEGGAPDLERPSDPAPPASEAGAPRPSGLANGAPT